MAVYKPYWGRILFSAIAVWMAAICIFALVPFVTKQLLDQAITTRHIPFTPIVWFVVAQILIPIFFRTSDWIMLHYQPLIRHAVANRLLDHMQLHSLRFFHSQFSGNLSSKVQDALTNVITILETILFDFSFSIFGVVSAIIAMSAAHSWFAAILLVWVVVFFSIPILTLNKAIRLSRQMSESGSEIMGQAVDIITNLMTVKLFAGYARERAIIQKQQNVFTQDSYRADRFLWFVNLLQALSFTVYAVIYIVLLSRWYPLGLVTPGDFILAIGINGSLIPMLWNTSQEIRNTVKKYSTLKQAIENIMQPYEIVDMQGAKRLVVQKGEIVFDRVRFGHTSCAAVFPGVTDSSALRVESVSTGIQKTELDPGSAPFGLVREDSLDEEVLFHNLSLTIPAGQKIGLVGYSGGGKTTFTNLLLRLFDVQSGKILIDGQDIKTVTQDSLRSQISLIPQDPTLFHRSLLENIRYGKPNALDKDVEKAAKQAHIHDFIMSLPEEYNSEVGERGLKLSGGQRQRIAIARALLKDAPIVIMDEATSQLDSLTERQIQNDAFQYMTGKTVIVIAHRLSTLQQMDRILVFEAGKIIQDGSHQDLLAQKGLYKTLWDTQYGD
jgi:ATP-binding cassette subfamily B protein